MNKYLIIIILALISVNTFAAVKILESTPERILIEFRIDSYTIETLDDYSFVNLPNLSYSSQIGAPLLPFEEIKVGVPAGGDISFSIQSISTQSIKLERPLMPAPAVISDDHGSQYIYEIDQLQYRTHKKNLIEPLNYTQFRGYSHIPIQINPFNYDGDREVVVTNSAIIQILIVGDHSQRSNEIEDNLSHIFLQQVINPEFSKNWHSSIRNQIFYADFSKSNWWVRIETDKDGFHKISHSQLSFWNLADIDPRSFRLFSTGGSIMQTGIVNAGREFMEVPISVVGEEDGSFDPSDFIFFYGTNRNGTDKNSIIGARHYINPYSHNTVYWLTFGGTFDGSPRRIQTSPELTSWSLEIDSQPEDLRIEEEIHRREVEGFDWYMTKLFGQTTADYEYQFTLDNVDQSKTQSLYFSLIQENIASVLSHSISVYVNNNLIQNPSGTDPSIFSWVGSGEYQFNRPHSFYVNGLNTLRIRVHRSRTDNLFFNYYTVSYYKNNIKTNQQYAASVPFSNYLQNTKFNFYGNSQNQKVFRVNSFSEITNIPIKTVSGGFNFIGNGISGTKFWVTDFNDLHSPVLIQEAFPKDIVNPITQIDNIIVSPNEFVDKAEELASFYNRHYNIVSKVVKQDDVFNQFNGGHPDPAAIKQYVRYLYANFPAPRITSMTLLGLGSIDWRNFSRVAQEKNKIMVYQKGKDVSDDFLGMINTANYPEIAIGRYPAKNLNELNIMLSNMTNYVENPTQGLWRNTVLMVADDLNNGNTTGEYVHTQQVQQTTDALSPATLVEMVLGIEYDYDEFQNKPKARDDMFEQINNGSLVWYYIGHGSYDKLGAEDYLNGATDMFRFNNPGKLNLFIAASCKVGHFDYWGFESLAQKVVLMDNKGSIASYAGTRETYPYQNAPLMIATLDHAINKRNAIGYSVLRGKIQVTQSNTNDEKYALLGDPLLRIIPPNRDSTAHITVNEENIREIRSGQKVDVRGHFALNNASGQADVRVYDTQNIYSLGPNTTMKKRGANIFRGTSSIQNSIYSASFFVPDDVTPGDSGLLLSYYWDSQNKTDYINYASNISISDDAVDVINNDKPNIELFLGSLDYRPGDTVGNNTTLYARISDENGINITGSPGHNILLILNNSSQPISATEYFSYDLDSHTQGLLTYPLRNLKEGPHTLQLIAFDNFNKPAVANTSFIVKKSGDLLLERLLPYPNPIKDNGYITFILSLDADVVIDFYTMSGKKVRTIKSQGKQGFNQIFWDGRDGDNHRLANNTYFVKVKATTPDKKSVEGIEKIVIFK